VSPLPRRPPPAREGSATTPPGKAVRVLRWRDRRGEESYRCEGDARVVLEEGTRERERAGGGGVKKGMLLLKRVPHDEGYVMSMGTDWHSQMPRAPVEKNETFFRNNATYIHLQKLSHACSHVGEQSV
jgi:hypothetical protein